MALQLKEANEITNTKLRDVEQDSKKTCPLQKFLNLSYLKENNTNKLVINVYNYQLSVRKKIGNEREFSSDNERSVGLKDRAQSVEECESPRSVKDNT